MASASFHALPSAPTSRPTPDAQNALSSPFVSASEPEAASSTPHAASSAQPAAPAVYRARPSRPYAPTVPLGAKDAELASQAYNRTLAALAADQRAALEPDTNTPFADAEDATRRLLPYHIFQLPPPDEGKGKGKARASAEEIAAEELAETHFALQCHRRARALETRFRAARTKSSKRTAPDAVAYWLEAKGLEDDKADLHALTHDLRAARAELERLERAARARPDPPATPTSAAAAPSTPTSAHAHQYRAYQLAYGQGSPPYYALPAAAPSTPASASFSAATSVPPTPTTAGTSAPASPASAMAGAGARGPVPLQLPASSVARLNALGIFPAARPTSAAVPAPSAVLLGTLNGGRTLSLEINLAVLQPAQMTGLAELLTEITQITRDRQAAAGS